MDRYLAANRELWEQWTALHEGSQFYAVRAEGLRTTGSRRPAHCASPG